MTTDLEKEREAFEAACRANGWHPKRLNWESTRGELYTHFKFDEWFQGWLLARAALAAPAAPRLPLDPTKEPFNTFHNPAAPSSDATFSVKVVGGTYVPPELDAVAPQEQPITGTPQQAAALQALADEAQMHGEWGYKAQEQPSDDERLTASEQRMLHDFPHLMDFYQKHALGPMRAPSCLRCGKSMQGEEPALKHLELPGIVICADCMAPSAAPQVGEIEAWRVRFPQYEYRPQDDCVALKFTVPQPAGRDAPKTPRYDSWKHLCAHGQWPDGVPAWARDFDGRMNTSVALRAVIDELAVALATEGDGREP